MVVSYHNLVLYDNGVITIGLFIYLIDPHKIDSNMWFIPLFCSDQSVFVMMPPMFLRTFHINHEVQRNG